METIVFACTTHVVYLIGFVVFAVLADRLPPLTPRRPFQATGILVSHPGFVLAFLIMIGGTVLAAAAVDTAPTIVLLPTYVVGLVLLLVIGTTAFRERLNAREWRAMALITLALAMLTVSAGLVTTGGFEAPVSAAHVRTFTPDLWKVGAVLIPCVLFPVWLFCVRDRKFESRHGRPLTGIAYGTGAGVLLGTAEAFGLGMRSVITDPGQLLTTAYLPVYAIAGALGLGLLQIALQQCRMIILCLLVNIFGKMQLLLAGTFLYGDVWPGDPVLLTLQISGLALAVVAVLTLPRHHRPAPWGRRFTHSTEVVASGRA